MINQFHVFALHEALGNRQWRKKENRREKE